MSKKRLSKGEKLERGASWVIGVILLAIILVVVIFFVRQKLYGPVFKYKGYQVTKVMPKGTSAVIYSLRAPIRIYASTKTYHINLYNDPRKLKDIEVENTTREVLLDPKPKHVYLTFDPELPNQGYVGLATTEIARILGYNGVFQLPVSGAVTKKVAGLENKTVTCNDSDENNLVIEFRYANETKIFVDEHYWRCVIVQGTNKDELLRAADKTILTLLGI